MSLLPAPYTGTARAIFLGNRGNWVLDTVQGNKVAEGAGELVGEKWIMGALDGAEIREINYIDNNNPGDALLATNDHASYPLEDGIDFNGEFSRLDTQATYNVTVNYLEGDAKGEFTARFNVLQLENGDLYLVPSYETGTQHYLDNFKIHSVTLDSVAADSNDNLFNHKGTIAEPDTYQVLYIGNLPHGLLDISDTNGAPDNSAAYLGTEYDQRSMWLETISYFDGADYKSSAGNGLLGTNNSGFSGADGIIFNGVASELDSFQRFNAEAIVMRNGVEETITLRVHVWQTKNGETFIIPSGVDGHQKRLNDVEILSIKLISTVKHVSDTLVYGNIGITGSTQPCFVTGTMIETERGRVAVEDLRVGDMVRTWDHGYQPISWIRGRPMPEVFDQLREEKRAIRIKAGAFGMLGPQQDLYVSAMHRLKVANEQTEALFGERAVLAHARHLVGLPGIELAPPLPNRAYYHILFATHEIIFANGMASESLYLGPVTLRALGTEGRREVESLTPELASPDFTPPRARRFLNRNEARQLVKAMLAAPSEHLLNTFNDARMM